jgi:hypothetical protein
VVRDHLLCDSAYDRVSDLSVPEVVQYVERMSLLARNAG